MPGPGGFGGGPGRGGPGGPGMGGPGMCGPGMGGHMPPPRPPRRHYGYGFGRRSCGCLGCCTMMIVPLALIILAIIMLFV